MYDDGWGSFLGRDAAYSDDKKDIYRKLTTDNSSLFQGKRYADLFLYAAILGFKNGQSCKLKKQNPNIPISAFSSKQKAILLALVIADTGDIDILLDEKAALKKIEEYANWGIDELESMVTSERESGDYLRQLKDEILGLSSYDI